MGIFGRNLNKKSGTPGGNYSPIGKHRVKIKACREREGFKGESTAIEYEMLDSNNPEAMVGSTYSWVQNYSNNPQYRDVKEGNLADFIRVGLQTMSAQDGDIVQIEEIEFDDGDLAAIFKEEQMFEGLELGLEVSNIQTREGNDFHKHVWFTLPELLEEDEAA